MILDDLLKEAVNEKEKKNSNESNKNSINWLKLISITKGWKTL